MTGEYRQGRTDAPDDPCGTAVDGDEEAEQLAVGRRRGAVGAVGAGALGGDDELDARDDVDLLVERAEGGVPARGDLRGIGGGER